jgi:hypothetical protein
MLEGLLMGTHPSPPTLNPPFLPPLSQEELDLANYVLGGRSITYLI